MINTLTSGKIKKLQRQESSPSISIYLPMKSGHQNADKNRITYKNALRVATRMMQNSAMPSVIRRDKSWLKNARSLADNSMFWESQSRGLAVYVTPKSVQAHRVNHEFEQRVFIGTNFITEPLMDIEPDAAQAFYVLTISKGSTRLFEYKGEKSKEIAKNTIPHDLKLSLNVDEPNKSLQTHMVGPAGSKSSETFHGQGYYKDQQKKLLEKYLRLVADRINKTLGNKTAPLFVIGTSTMVAQYRKFNKYKNFAQSNIYRNADKLNVKQVQELLMANKVLSSNVG